MRPVWGDISEAEDLLRLHKLKPLTHGHSLTCALLLYNPVGKAPFLAATLKYMYKYLIMTQNLDCNAGVNYNKILSEHFIANHLQPAVVARAIATEKHLQTRQNWRLDPCIPYDKIRTSLDTMVDGSWGCLSGSASLTYMIQRYEFQGRPRVSIYLCSSNTSMNSLTKLGHQVDAELKAFSCDVTDVKKASGYSRT